MNLAEKMNSTSTKLICINPNGVELFRSHSRKYLKNSCGEFSNPNIARIRRPKDTPENIHKILQRYFLDKFGVDYRGKSLFCTGNYETAAGYKSEKSEIISIKPVGEFSACYSRKCRDPFEYCQFKWTPQSTSEIEIREELDALDYLQVQNGGLLEAASSGSEVMLIADYFSYRLVERFRRR